MSEDSHLSDEARKQADIIFRQAQKLKQLIADLNLTSKLEYAMQPLKLEKLDILELIRQIVKAHEGQIFFEKNVPDGLCVKITLLKNWASETE